MTETKKNIPVKNTFPILKCFSILNIYHEIVLKLIL